MFLDQDNDLVFEYSKYYRLAEYFNPGFKNSLLIGGGAYSFPKDYLKRYKDSYLDVVEIDPQLTKLAEEYFGLKTNQHLNIHHQDGRIFLNRTTNKYDIIYLDVFKSFEVPYHLTTKETVGELYQVLNDNGVVLLNLISSIEGNKGKFLRAEYATYKSIFPQVYLLPVRDVNQSEESQNIILVALKSKKIPDWTSNNQEFNQYLKHLWRKDIPTDLPILSDDFSPVDQYMMELIM
jgi:spermidine synthase